MTLRSSPRWDSKRFIADFTQSQCYQEPLKLEPGKDGTFLETRIWIKDNEIRHKLKNDNEGGQTKIWRYKHFDDGSPFMEKRATLTACLNSRMTETCQTRVLRNQLVRAAAALALCVAIKIPAAHAMSAWWTLNPQARLSDARRSHMRRTRARRTLSAARSRRAAR